MSLSIMKKVICRTMEQSGMLGLLGLLGLLGRACAERNNVLFVIVDDLRPVLGCYGDEKAHTPNLDQLAGNSVIFEKAYAQQALCAPSRNSLLTSRRPDTLALYDFYSYWRQVAGNYTTLPQYLRQLGYTTLSFGKIFHPGASCNYSDDSPYSWSEPPFHPKTERYKDAPVCSKHHSSPASNLVCPVRLSLMPNATLPDIETVNAATTFLRTHKKEPFFLAVGFHKPHIPFKYPKRYLKYHPLNKFSIPNNYEWPKNVSSIAYNPWTDIRQRSDVEKLGLKCPWDKIPENYARKIIQSYYAAVTYIDELLGKLLKELESLKIRNRTVIVFTSDHGWSLGEHAEWAKYSNFEVALRVPLIISIPNVTFKFNEYVTSAKVIYEPVELLDIFPTIVELAGNTIPKCLPITDKKISDLCTEGSSLIPLIDASLNYQSIAWRKGAISQYPRPGLIPSCKPSSDKPRLENITIMGYTLRTRQYRYIGWFNFSILSMRPHWEQIVAEELYDHNIDPEENFNKADFKNFYSVKHNLRNMMIHVLK